MYVILSFFFVVSLVTLSLSTKIDFIAAVTVDLFVIVSVYSIWSPDLAVSSPQASSYRHWPFRWGGSWSAANWIPP